MRLSEHYMSVERTDNLVLLRKLRLSAGTATTTGNMRRLLPPLLPLGGGSASRYDRSQVTAGPTHCSCTQAEGSWGRRGTEDGLTFTLGAADAFCCCLTKTFLFSFRLWSETLEHFSSSCVHAWRPRHRGDGSWAQVCGHTGESLCRGSNSLPNFTAPDGRFALSPSFYADLHFCFSSSSVYWTYNIKKPHLKR